MLAGWCRSLLSRSHVFGLQRCVVLHARALRSKPNEGPSAFAALRRDTHYGKGLRPFDRAGLAARAAEPHRGREQRGSANERKTDVTNTIAKPVPTHRIYSVSRVSEAKAKWQEIGAVWPHKDGNGFNLQFAARPLEGAAIILRTVKAKNRGAQ